MLCIGQVYTATAQGQVTLLLLRQQSTESGQNQQTVNSVMSKTAKNAIISMEKSVKLIGKRTWRLCDGTFYSGLPSHEQLYASFRQVLQTHIYPPIFVVLCVESTFVYRKMVKCVGKKIVVTDFARVISSTIETDFPYCTHGVIFYLKKKVSTEEFSRTEWLTKNDNVQW